MTRVVGACVLSAAVIAAGCGPKSIPPTHDRAWELRGSVEAISPTRLDVRHKSGRVIELEIDNRTEILGSAGKELLAAVAPGMRVAIHVETDATGAWRARIVRVFN